MANQKEKLILRDTLALDRTKLANQRTLLSYSRTGFSFIVTALAIFEFSSHTLAHVSAWLLIGIGTAIIVRGFITYTRMRKAIDRIYGGR